MRRERRVEHENQQQNLGHSTVFTHPEQFRYQNDHQFAAEDDQLPPERPQVLHPLETSENEKVVWGSTITGFVVLLTNKNLPPFFPSRIRMFY